MAQPAAGTRQYFLGIEGEQKGPLSESDVLAKIRAGEVPSDALIWYEGMGDWQLISSMEPFKSALRSGDSAPAASTPAPAAGQPVYKPKAQQSAQSDDENMFTFADSKGASEPVFEFEEPGFLKRRMGTIVGVIILLVICSVGGFYFQDQIVALVSSTVQPPPRAAKRIAPQDQRALDLSKAQSELLLNPDLSLKTLEELAKGGIGDTVSREALATAVDYYKKMQRPANAGRLLMDAKHPEEAVKFFMMDPPSFKEAEEAYYAAYQGTKDPKRREFLLEDIRLLLGPLSDVKLATQRIKELEKAFPNQPHPFRYYSKTIDEKIKDIFSRISFSFVESLLLYVNAELPQINLVDRPLVEIKKDKEGLYRVVGTFKGDVRLNQDRLHNIFIVFWLSGDQWIIADTNLTEERKLFAKQEREKHKGDAMSADSMLSFLETSFKSHFPKVGLHEKVDTASQRSKNLDD